MTSKLDFFEQHRQNVHQLWQTLVVATYAPAGRLSLEALFHRHPAEAALVFHAMKEEKMSLFRDALAQAFTHSPVVNN